MLWSRAIFSRLRLLVKNIGSVPTRKIMALTSSRSENQLVKSCLEPKIFIQNIPTYLLFKFYLKTSINAGADLKNRLRLQLKNRSSDRLRFDNSVAMIILIELKFDCHSPLLPLRSSKNRTARPTPFIKLLKYF